MNRKCRHPSRQGFKCGGRERPSGCSVIGTSAMRNDFKVALITISEANSMPVVLSSSFRQASLESREARNGNPAPGI